MSILSQPCFHRHSVVTFRWLNDYARQYTDVTITNITDDIGTLGIAGPHSREVLSKLTDTDMRHEKFKFLTVKDIDIAGIPVKALRLSYTGTIWTFET